MSSQPLAPRPTAHMRVRFEYGDDEAASAEIIGCAQARKATA
jgi:hypothetical protein